MANNNPAHIVLTNVRLSYHTWISRIPTMAENLNIPRQFSSKDGSCE